MKILLITEYIRRFAWSPSAWAVDLARGMTARGHEVTVACDGLDDDSMLAGVRLLVRRPDRTVRGSDPSRFQRWAMGVRAGLRDHASLSLSPWFPGDVWIRMDADSAATALRAIRAHRPVSAVLELAHRPWLLAALLAESRAVRMSARVAGGVRRLRFGADAAEDEAHALLYASRLPRPGDAESEARRSRVRAALGLNAARPVLLMSVMEVDGPALEGFFGGMAEVRRRRPGAAPVVLVASRRSYSVSCAAQRAGCEPGVVRLIGATARMADAMAACDAAVAAGPDRGSSAGARFLADALRSARPVLAHRRAAGSALLEPAHFGTAPLGLLAEDSTAESWAGVLETALSDGWLARARGAAHDAGPALSMDGLISRLERHLSRRD